jgi:3-oxoacyl-[acyl-carrier protein] reductase
MGRLDGKVAFITGGGIGFGRAFARALASEGASIAIADIDAEAGTTLAKELEDAGHRALAVVCDVADEHQVDLAVAQVTNQFGGVDVLINNAGKHLTKYNQPFSVLERDELRALFNVNVIGVVNCSVACQPSMASRGGGIIVNISSMAAYSSTTPYSVSKLAVRGLTIAFATEFAADNIRVNAIAPGLMATENAMADLPQSLVDEFVEQRQLIHRLGHMDDIVNAMLYLCSDESSFVTGETLKVTGGHPLFV